MPGERHLRVKLIEKHEVVSIFPKKLSNIAVNDHSASHLNSVPNAVRIPWSVNLEGWGVRVNLERWTFKFTAFRVFLIAFSTVALCATGYRLALGLQAVTNLNDAWPWGLWKAVAVFGAIALAGGGFGTAFLVHVLHIKALQPLARTTLAVSMIGYFLGLGGLFLEIGRWFNFWTPFYSWGHTSPMFETFICISTYTVVQCFEFAEIVTEKVFRKLHRFFASILPVMIVVGVMLPTMHQSTLGTLYLLAEGKLSPLWWSPIIYLLFLLSSLYVGPATVAVISVLNDWSLGHKIPVAPMRLLARIGGVLMLVYLLLRIGDLMLRGQMGTALNGSIESQCLMVEIGLGLILPLLIVFSPLANTRWGLVTYGVFGSLGVFANRANTVVVGMWENAGGVTYLPSPLEWVIVLGFITSALLGYIFLCENFNILGQREGSDAAHLP